MSYTSQETAEHTGQPVELFFFAHGARAWRYTSASHDISPPASPPMDGLYLATAIKRSAIAQSTEKGRNTLTLDVPRDMDLLREFVGVPLPGAVAVTVMRLHQRDDAFELLTVWTGRVLGASWRADAAKLECEPSSVSLARNGLRQLYALTCTHVLYDSLCKAAPIPVANAVFSVSGVAIEMAPASLLPGEFAGGWVEAVGGDKKTMIVSNTDSTVTLLSLSPFIEGEAVMLYRGCDKTLTTCRDKFGNLPNYGGFPFIPNKNPFNAGVF